MTPLRPVRLFGDSAVVIEVDTVDEAHAVASSVPVLAAHVEGLDASGIEDVIVGYRSVTVVVDPTVVDVALLADTLTDTLTDALASGEPNGFRSSAGRLVEIPVALDGSDLGDVARIAGMTPDKVVILLAEADLRVAFVGFAPGFAYLEGLDRDLAAVPRRPTPRPVVTGGSVGLAGGFVGIYPQASPGGWHVVGRTDMRLFDPDAPPYSALRAGDRVRLSVVDPETRAGPGPRLEGRAPCALTPTVSWWWKSRVCCPSSRTAAGWAWPGSVFPAPGPPTPTHYAWPTDWWETTSTPPPSR